MIQAVAGNAAVPGVVVGVGSDVPERTDAGALPAQVRRRPPVRDLHRPHRREQGLQGAVRALPALRRGVSARRSISCSSAAPMMPIPQHPRIHHLGFLSDEDKFDALAASDLLIMPSYFESLSMVALEAWALGRPVLANGRCDVLKGQCIRSNAGSLLRELRGVRRGAVRARVERPAARRARPERPRLLPPQLRLAGHRAEIPGHARAPPGGSARAGGDRAAARLVRQAQADAAPGRRRPCRGPVGTGSRQPRGGQPAMSATAARTPRVHQVLATLGYGDAIGHEVLGIQRALRVGRIRVARSSSRPPIRRLEDLTLDYRDMVGDDRARRRPHPSLLDRIARVAHRVCAAGPDGARLPQHHAARVLPRRPQGSRQALLPRPARADRLHRPLRPRARRLRIQPPGARGARLLRRPACCRSCPTSRHLDLAAGSLARGGRSTTSGPT